MLVHAYAHRPIYIYDLCKFKIRHDALLLLVHENMYICAPIYTATKPVGDLDLGRLYIVLSDQLEKRLRLEIVRRFGGKKGDLSNAIEESVKMWLEAPEPKTN